MCGGYGGEEEYRGGGGWKDKGALVWLFIYKVHFFKSIVHLLHICERSFIRVCIKGFRFHPVDIL